MPVEPEESYVEKMKAKAAAARAKDKLNDNRMRARVVSHRSFDTSLEIQLILYFNDRM